MPNQEIVLPVLIGRGVVVYPGFRETIEIGRAQSKEVIELALDKFEGKVFLVSQKNVMDEEVKVEDAYLFGTLVSVEVTKRWKDGTLTVSLTGISRAQTEAITLDANNIPMANLETLTTAATEENLATAVDLIKVLKDEMVNVPQSVTQFLENPTAEMLSTIIDTLASETPQLAVEQKLQLIQNLDPVGRLEILLGSLAKADKQKQVREVDNDISNKIKQRMDQQQREYYLREKMRTIKEELGEGDDADSNVIQKYRERLETEPFPQNVKERIISSINKLDTIQNSSPEANVERNYIDWMMSIPWWEKSEDIQDLKHAKEVLDSHHFGLDKVKDRIIEYLAVAQKTKSLKGQIITLVGPPGVGKTSLARSIAEAIGRNFVKVSLGGVRDEAEIRGHRKTYVASMPGRIIQAMKRAKVKNPLFLLDEIDKMSSDQRGDPASAMLEVLDPEQNVEFSDHYIEEPYDLSEVMFIATANYPENIPEALYDRMEIINLSSYTEIEKVSIAKDYLVPKVLKEHALTNEEIQFSDESIDELIKYYTREAGVRQLERLLSAISRKFIVKLLNKEVTSLNTDVKIVNEYLGKRLFEHTDKQANAQVGVVTGLAYTQFGGDILPIEVNYFPGKGNLTLTGKLGEVMKESASIAYDYVRANYQKFGIKKEIFENNDVHIHVPEGAVPKDGPSAGVTITTAIVSALSGRPVSKDIGMTGEITLRGLVLPIGGLREKSISAARSGLKMILIPMRNLKDLDDVPEEVKKVLEIKGIERFEETFEEVFGEKISPDNVVK